MALDFQSLLGNIPGADVKQFNNMNGYQHLMRGGILGLLQGKYDPNAMFSGGNIVPPPWGNGGGGPTPPAPPTDGGSGGGNTPPARWDFPEYTQNWAFTPPAPFYTAPPPVFNKSNYSTSTTKK